MAESSPKSEDTDSPVLSYSMALREGKRMLSKLEELMATPIADIEQPSLVDFTLSSSLASPPGGSGDDLPRRQLLAAQRPAAQDGGAVCLLDTSNRECSPFGSAASRTTAMNKLHMGDHHNGRADGVPTRATSNGGGILFNAHELSLLENRRDGDVPTAPTSTETLAGKSSVPGRDTMPLIYFTPVVPRRKPTRGFLAQSDPEAVVPDRVADEERSVAPSHRCLSYTVAPAADSVEVDEAAAATVAPVPFDATSDRRLSFIVARAEGPPDVDEAAATLPVPSDVAFDRRLGFVVVPATEPAEADEATTASSPDLPTTSDTRCSHTQLSDMGEDSFHTAYESPMHSSRRSFVISRHEPPVSSDGVAAGDHDLPDSVSGNALTSDDLPKAAVVAETTLALPAPPSKPASRPRIKASSTAAANATVVVASRKPVSRPAGSALATRKSLLPQPTASRRPERASTLVQARVPLGRPSGAPKAAPRPAEETSAMDSAARPAPPAGVPNGAPLQLQPKKQEQLSVRPKVPAPRGPVGVPPVAASPASRQSMRAPGVANGAARRIAAGRRAVLTKTAVPPEPSVEARPTRPPAPTSNAAAGATLSSAPSGLGGASKTRVFLPEPRGEPQAPKAQPPRSRIAAPKTRAVAGGFSRLPTMAGSSVGNRVALLAPAPVPESPESTRLSSTPLRGDVPPINGAVGVDLTRIHRP